MKLLWIFFGGQYKNGLVLGVISMYLVYFLRVNIQKGDILEGCKNFKYLFGVLDFPDILTQSTVDARSKPTYDEKIE